MATTIGRQRLTQAQIDEVIDHLRGMLSAKDVTAYECNIHRAPEVISPGDPDWDETKPQIQQLRPGPETVITLSISHRRFAD